MAAVLPQDLAQAITYGPATAQAIRRSQYLSDALSALGKDGSTNIHSPGELAAKLLSFAILNRSTDKAQKATIDAVKADQNAETDKMLGALRPPPAASPQPGFVSQDTMPPPSNVPLDPGMSVPNSSPSAPQTPATATLTPEQRDLMARVVYGEASGEGAPGQQAVADVILNRSRASGKPVDQVIRAPHQFAGLNARAMAATPDQLAPIAAAIDPVLAGQVPDATGGADHFYNPRLATPAWGGPGQDIGQHRFLRLGDQGHAPAPDVQMTGGPAPQGLMQVSPSMAAAQGVPQSQSQPYQVAANGQTPSPPQASAPGPVSPPAAGGPPVAVPPQAMAAGGSPPMKQVSSWPMWKPSGQEIGFVESLLRDPRTHQQGVQAAIAMRQKMTQPVEATMQLVNGVPVYFGKDPTDGAVMVMPVPKEAMSQHADGPAAGLPPGVMMDTKPTGDRSVVYKPPEGYQAGPSGGLQYQPGGPADPTRPQPAPQGYQYQQAPGQPGAPMQQGPILGGPADPRAPMNLLQGTQSVQKELRPLVDLAVVAKQSFGAVQTGFHQQNGTGDIAMINGLQHLIDKGVVRGEDITTQMKSNGIDGTLGGLLQYVHSAGMLTPEVRQRVLKTATDLYGNLDQTYRAQVMGYRQTVDAAYGKGAFDQYVMPAETAKALGWNSPPAGAPGAGAPPAVAPQFKPGSPDAGVAEAVKRGMRLSPQQQQRALQLGLIR